MLLFYNYVYLPRAEFFFNDVDVPPDMDEKFGREKSDDREYGREKSDDREYGREKSVVFAQCWGGIEQSITFFFLLGENCL